MRGRSSIRVRSKTCWHVSDAEKKPAILFLALGRRGASVRYGHEIASALAAESGTADVVLMSRQSDGFDAASRACRATLIGADLFKTNAGAILNAWRLPLLRRQIANLIRERNIHTVVDLMPHVWSPLLIGAIRRAGAHYVGFAHDITAHPGDGTARAAQWSERALLNADRVIAFSDTVAGRLAPLVPQSRIRRVFHPMFGYTASRRRHRTDGQPLRVLFLGRMMPYKGLPLLVDAIGEMRQQGVPVHLSVYGEGDLSGDAAKLTALGADVCNRWLSDAEIAKALDVADVMALSHIEASQSGVVAAAYGAGLPVVATPVGALPEQVIDGETGLVASSVDAGAIAKALTRLALEPDLYAKLVDGALAHAQAHSFPAFIAAVRALTADLRG